VLNMYLRNLHVNTMIQRLRLFVAKGLYRSRLLRPVRAVIYLLKAKRTMAKRITSNGIPMTKLTTKKRKALPKAAFAGPDKSYPVNDKSHAANAKARATQMEAKGKLSPSAKAKIDAKANKVLGKPKKK